MTRLIPALAAALLATAIATPVFAQAAIQEPGAYAFYHPDADVLAGRQAYRPPADANAYYMLTYRNTHREDGKFHPVDLRVKRPRVQLRARNGYWAASAQDRLAAELLAIP